MSHIIRNEERTDAFKRNPELEALLDKLNSLLRDSHTRAIAAHGQPRYPVVFVVGGPRSGTTLMMQWLAASRAFGYPSNLVARFYGAPYIGGLIHEMMLNPRYAYRQDFGDLKPYTLRSDFSSDLGKTVGFAAPNVFWYFWRRFFDFPECPYLDDARRAAADAAGFVRELAALEAAFDRPFALKGVIANWNLDFLDGLLDHALFIHVRRQPAFQIASILAARRQFRGDPGLWWGFKPPELGRLPATASPEEEVALQVYSTRRAVARALASMAPERHLTVDYEAFCSDPAPTFAAVAERLERQGYTLPDRYPGEPTFVNNNPRYADAAPDLERTYHRTARAIFPSDDPAAV